MSRKRDRRYTGRILGSVEYVVLVDGKPLNPRTDIVAYTDGSFRWGGHGKHEAQLALAICADALEDDQAALSVHHKFKAEVVSNLPTSVRWELDAKSVAREIERIAGKYWKDDRNAIRDA